MIINVPKCIWEGLDTTHMVINVLNYIFYSILFNFYYLVSHINIPRPNIQIFIFIYLPQLPGKKYLPFNI